jgi:hypothetical protein
MALSNARYESFCRETPTLEHIEAAVAHHAYEEESNWFLDLKSKTPVADQVKLTQRYQEHFARCSSPLSFDAPASARAFCSTVQTIAFGLLDATRGRRAQKPLRPACPSEPTSFTRVIIDKFIRRFVRLRQAMVGKEMPVGALSLAHPLEQHG